MQGISVCWFYILQLYYIQKIWNASWICVSSLHRGHANLLCIVPILVYVLPKRALSLLFNMLSRLVIIFFPRSKHLLLIYKKEWSTDTRYNVMNLKNIMQSERSQAQKAIYWLHLYEISKIDKPRDKKQIVCQDNGEEGMETDSFKRTRFSFGFSHLRKLQPPSPFFSTNIIFYIIYGVYELQVPPTSLPRLL